MNIIYVPSLPIYHELTDNDGFLELADRDKWMPSLLNQKGYPTQLWAAGYHTLKTEWQYDDLPTLPVRIFKTDSQDGDIKKHASRSLNRAVFQEDIDFVIIKGMDGGVGLDLIKRVLIPRKIPFATIINGTWYHPAVKHAAALLYETEWQRKQLTTRSLRFWRSVVDDRKMIHLAKSVDTRHFSPNPKIQKECDVIGMERILTDSDKISKLIELSRHVKVGIIGGGTELYNFRKRYPEITWFGAVPYSRIPDLMNKGRLFFHSGFRKDHPRAISEAAACGVPPVAFGDVIHSDVLPDHIGLRVDQNSFISEITALLDNQKDLQSYSKAARAHAENVWNHKSTLPAIRELILRFKNKGKK